MTTRAAPRPTATRRRSVPVGAGLPDWLYSNHPLGLAAFALSVLLAAALFLDEPLLHLAQALNPARHQVYAHVTGIGDSTWKILSAATLVLLFRTAARRSPRIREAVLYRHAAALAAFVLASVLVSGIAANILKRLIGRARPMHAGTEGVFGFHPFDPQASWASFPSGHATTIFALAVALSLLFPRLRLAFLSVAAWVALSRVMIGVHWASDVLAGAALGTATTLLLRHWFAERGWAFVWRAGTFRPRSAHLPALVGVALRALPGQIQTICTRAFARALAVFSRARSRRPV